MLENPKGNLRSNIKTCTTTGEGGGGDGGGGGGGCCFHLALP
jgi:hypothetical protein